MVSFAVYLLFVFSYFLHFTERFPILGLIRFDFILMIVLSVFLITSLNVTIQRYRQSNIVKNLLVFILYFLLTIPLVKWPGSVVKYGIDWYLKVVFFFFYTIAFVDSEKKLKIFIFAFIGCQILRGLEPAWMHYTSGYWGDVAFSHVGGTMTALDRLSGSPYDVINPNQLAWVIVNTVPFIYFFGWFKRKLFLKFLTTTVSAFLIYALLLTGSRSGLICLFVVFFGIVFFSEKRWRNIILFCFVIVPVSMIVSGLLNPNLAERYLSLIDSSAAGADTAQGRINGLFDTLSTIMNQYGFLGHGLGTSREVNVNYLGSKLVSHNFYIESLQEVGIVGAFLIFKYVYSIFYSLRDAIKTNEKTRNDFISLLLKALIVWEIMQLIYCLSCFSLSSWEWYFFGGVVVVALKLNDEQKTKYISLQSTI